MIGRTTMNVLPCEPADLALALFEKSPDPLFLVDVDAGHVVDANPAAARLTGLARPQLQNTTLADRFRRADDGAFPLAGRGAGRALPASAFFLARRPGERVVARQGVAHPASARSPGACPRHRARCHAASGNRRSAAGQRTPLSRSCRNLQRSHLVARRARALDLRQPQRGEADLRLRARGNARPGVPRLPGAGNDVQQGAAHLQLSRSAKASRSIATRQCKSARTARASI